MYKQGSIMQKVCKLRPKFNESLNSAVAKLGQNVMHICSCNSGSHFDHHGNLTLKGKHSFWREVDDLIKLFDIGEIKLLPKEKTSYRGNQHGNGNRDRKPHQCISSESCSNHRKMPTPPPKCHSGYH